MIKIFLKNGEIKEFPPGVTIKDVLKEIGGKIVKDAVAARINGKAVDLSTVINNDTCLEFITFDDPEGKEIYHHSASHLMAQAVKRLYPEANLGIGPAIKDGFYYDIELDETLSSDDFTAIEKEIQKIIKDDLPVIRKEMSREEALDFFARIEEPYKLELIKELPEGTTISCYGQGEFWDLCFGPHVISTGKIKALKLLSIAGAYWKGDEKNAMLQRIYGTAFPKKKLLDDYLYRLEEAKKRDHRKIGRDLSLFSFHEEGPGFPFYHPKGIIIRRELEEFWRKEHRRAGYKEIETPVVLNRELWEKSGHWEHYRENMYFTAIDEDDYAIKPMNCPGTMLVYKTEMHSYKELPLRLAEMGVVHRHEKSGTLHGLMRVRSFTQDDAHIFMLMDQIEGEVEGVMDLIDKFYSVFKFNYYIELSTKPEKAMGSPEIWEKATAALRNVLEKKGKPYKINEGDGAFYGPKIDFHLEDCLGRTWQCGTIQLDFQMPEKFDLNYIGSDGQKHRPVMIHRVVYGALERFIALLIEHFAGAFPTWLAPVQVVLIPVTDRQHTYAKEVMNALLEEDIRLELDDRSEKVGYKIRDAQLQKIPYMLILGEKEEKEQLVALRCRQQGDLGPVQLSSFLKQINEEIQQKK